MHKRRNPPKEHVAEQPTKKRNAPLTEVPNEWERKILRGSLHSRLAAVKEAGELRDIRALHAIMQILTGEDKGMDDAALEAVRKMGNLAIDPVLRLLEQDPCDNNACFCMASATTHEGEKCREAIPAMIRAFNRLFNECHEDPRLMECIGGWMDTFVNVGDRRAVEPLEAALVFILIRAKMPVNRRSLDEHFSDFEAAMCVKELKEALLGFGVSEQRLAQISASADMENKTLVNANRSREIILRAMKRAGIELEGPGDKSEPESN